MDERDAVLHTGSYVPLYWPKSTAYYYLQQTLLTVVAFIVTTKKVKPGYKHSFFNGNIDVVLYVQGLKHYNGLLRMQLCSAFWRLLTSNGDKFEYIDRKLANMPLDRHWVIHQYNQLLHAGACGFTKKSRIWTSISDLKQSHNHNVWER